MLCLQNIKFLSKVQGLLDRLNPPQTVLRIVIDENFVFPPLTGATKQNLTSWEEHQIPPIEMSPYQKAFFVEFAVYRDGINIGLGKSAVAYAESKKDCIDTIDKDNHISGKISFEANWVNQKKSGKYLSFEQYCQAKEKGQVEGGKTALITPTMPTQKVKYVREEAEDDCGGFCGCFTVRKKKPTKKPVPPIQDLNPSKPFKQQLRLENIKLNVDPQPPKVTKLVNPYDKFKNSPLLYFQQQLQEGKNIPVEEPRHLVYYSKSIIQSK